MPGTGSGMGLGKTGTKLIVGCLVGAGFLYLALRNVDFSQMGEAFLSAHYGYLLGTLVIIFFSHILRALRWKYLMAPIKEVDIRSLFVSLIIGYMANVVMPAHLGEIVRAYVLGRKRGVSASSALATIVVERILDVFALMGIMVLSILLYPFPGWMKNAGYLMLAGAVALLFFLILLKAAYPRIQPFIGVILRPLPPQVHKKVLDFLEKFIAGIVPLRSGPDYAIVILLSIGIWVLYGLIFHLTLHAFDFFEIYQLPWFAGLIPLVVTTLAIVIPSSPGYVGTYHYLCQVAMAMFGVPAGPALSFGTAVHAVNFLPILIAGLILAYYEGVQITQFNRR
ncbi:MAG: flippase-like domain-containing protein [Deltaproteobacteria bacterium]|nr:flippase-like domain-containing protein [Deltaproteobacteria bacterium]